MRNGIESRTSCQKFDFLIDEEHSCQISSHSSLKQQNVRMKKNNLISSNMRLVPQPKNIVKNNNCQWEAYRLWSY